MTLETFTGQDLKNLERGQKVLVQMTVGEVINSGTDQELVCLDLDSADDCIIVRKNDYVELLRVGY